MLEIYFLPSNIIPTTLFLVIILYWLIVLFGAVDTDLFDFDVDVDVDTDIDVDADVETSSNIFGWNKVLSFFNLGKIPFMVFLTFLVLPWWIMTVLVNHFFGIESFLIGLIVLVPTFIGALLLSKILTTPFVKIFALLDKDESTRDILGTIGEVRMGASEASTGMAEFKVGNRYLSLYIRTKEGQVNRGDHVMLINDDHKDEYYIVEKQIQL